MTLTLREFREEIFGRSIRYILSPFNLSMKQAEARAAKEIAAEYRVKAAREKKRAPVMSMPAPVSNDADVNSELVGAKERFFGMLQSYFARFDANRARERAAKRAAKRSIPRRSLTRPAPVAPQPDPLPDNVHVFPLVYTGAERSAQHISDEGYLPRWRDITMANNRASIERNAAIERQRQQQKSTKP